MKSICLTLIFGILVSSVYSLSLPEYIKPCKRSDPNLSKCALENGLKAFNRVIEGDKKYSIPKLNPLILPSVEIVTGTDLKLNFKKLVVDGLQNVIIKSLNIDLEKKHLEMKLDLDQIKFDGQYEVEGKILVLPIKGSGDAKIILNGGKYVYSIDWTLEKKNRKDYLKIQNSNFEFKLTGASFQLDNLFNGDKTLGDNMNKVLNENWEDVVKEVGKGIVDTVKTIADEIFANYISIVPYHELFID